MRGHYFAAAVTLALVSTFTLGVASAQPEIHCILPCDGPVEKVKDFVSDLCILGSDGNCIIPIYCVMEPCPHFP